MRIARIGRILRALAFVVVLVTPLAHANAQTGEEIIIQGFVTAADGTPVDGIFDATLSIFEEELGGFRLWTEEQILVVDAGFLTAVLGVLTPLPPEVFDGRELWAEIALHGLPAPPRQPLVSTDVTIGADVFFSFAFEAVEVGVTFETVTKSGKGNVTKSKKGPPLPSDFDEGTDPTYYDVSTTAEYTGTVTVCIPSDPTAYSNPDSLHLLHYEGGGWVDVPPLVPYETIVLDAAGLPAEGVVSVRFTVYDDPEDKVVLWVDDLEETVVAGHYSTLLGSSNPLPRELFDGTVRFLGVRVGADAERMPLELIGPDAVCGQVLTLSPFVIAERESIAVDIDIKPGSDVNAINRRSRGTTPVAILSSATFDAPANVMVPMLTFGRTGKEQSLAGCAPAGEDVNGDGLLDLVCHFFTRLTGFQPGDTEGILEAAPAGGTPIKGADSIRMVGR